MINKLTKNFKLAADCLYKFYSNYILNSIFVINIDLWLIFLNQLFLKDNAMCLKRSIDPRKPMEPGTKPAILRMLFTLGLLSKHFDVESDELKEFKVCTKQDLFDIFLYFVRNFDVDVQQKALNGLGSFLTRYFEYMMRDEIKNLYLDCMKRPDAPLNLKSQVK